jgi:hypothetical protein
MTKKQLAGILSVVDAQILKIVTERRGVDCYEAVELLYSSSLYSKLEDEKTKLWHLSAETLYNLLDEELTTGKITYPEEQ